MKIGPSPNVDLSRYQRAEEELEVLYGLPREVRFCVLSFTSDWLYPTRESRNIVRALNAAGARASFVEIVSDKGHDAFLLEEPQMDAALTGFLASAATERGLAR